LYPVLLFATQDEKQIQLLLLGLDAAGKADDSTSLQIKEPGRPGEDIVTTIPIVWIFIETLKIFAQGTIVMSWDTGGRNPIRAIPSHASYTSMAGMKKTDGIIFVNDSNDPNCMYQTRARCDSEQQVNIFLKAFAGNAASLSHLSLS